MDKRKKILVVDDQADLGELYKTVLMEQGHLVVVTQNPEAALELAEKDHLDLVLLDIRMPGMDGIELLHQLTNRKPSLKVIINTAYPSYKENYLTWPAVSYLVKSSDLTELTDTVNRVLAS
ncbi:MAG: response regulator [Deltaproteobacteria bacterium]|nr:response regulator [Deltaproteobacteria bacterium]